MLALTRRVNEVVVITTPDGSEIRVTVVEWDRTKVRLSFDAPRNVVIDRLEVHTEKQRLALPPHRIALPSHEMGGES